MSALETLETLLKAFPSPPKRGQKSPDDDDEPAPGMDDSDGGGDGFDDADDSAPAGDVDGDGDADIEDDDAPPPDDDGDVDGPPEGAPGAGGGMPPGAGTPGAGAAGGGDANALAQQLVQAERDYYAAKGFHGDPHHNTHRALDTLMRIMRKFVRAVTGGQMVDGMQPQGAAPGAPGEGAPGPDDEDGDIDPDADDEEGFDDDGEGADPEGGDAYDDTAFDGDDDESGGDFDGDGDVDEDDEQKARLKRFGKSRAAMEHGYRVFARKHGHEAFLGLRKAQPANDGGWHYPENDQLSKGIWDFRDRDVENVAKVPEQFLFPYLVAFIEAAYQDCCAYAEDVQSDAAKSAARIMLKLVTLLPNSANLKAAATKYKITEAGIAKILLDKGIIKSADGRTADVSTDAQSIAAMGGMGKSDRDWWAQRADLARAQVPLKLTPLPASVKVIDDRVIPTMVPAASPRFYGRDALAKATVGTSCDIHNSQDKTKTDMLAHPFAKCSCPR